MQITILSKKNMIMKLALYTSIYDICDKKLKKRKISIIKSY